MNHSIGFRERRILRLESDWLIVCWAPIAVIKLWWTWTYLPTQWPWASSHVCSFREQQEEFHHDNTKAHLRWPVISSVSAVLDKTLALHQHGPPPKGLPASREWPPAPVSNPWDKNFTPKEAPTSVKVLVNLPKRWEPVDTSPLMLNPPKVTAVHQVPDSEISRFAVWLEAFSTRAAHSAALSATMLEASYMQNLMVIEHLCESAPSRIRCQKRWYKLWIFVHNKWTPLSWKHNWCCMTLLLQWRSSMPTSICVAGGKFWNLRSACPREVKIVYFCVLSAANDLFGPSATQVEDLRRDPQIENALLLAEAIEQAKGSKLKATSSQSRPPRSLAHTFPVELASPIKSLQFAFCSNDLSI